MTATQILLSKVRKIMPAVIAHQLVGVQPMTDPIGLGGLYPEIINIGLVSMEKIHYQHFLRIYNRKRTQTVGTLVDAGYTKVKVSRYLGYLDARAWCSKNLKPGSWVSSTNTFCFAYDRDATLFSLRWSS